MLANGALIGALEKHGISSTSLRPLIDTGQDTSYGFALHGSEAIPTWQRLRMIVEETGHWPVVLGDGDDLQQHTHDIRVKYIRDPYNQTAPEVIIERALGLDPVDLLKERLEGALPEEDYEEDDEEEAPLSGGEWPADFSPGTTYAIPFDSNGEPLPEVYIGLLPTRVGWHAPAFLKIGDWNYCPSPDEHVAVLKRWHELYDADVVAMRYDTFELKVGRPPADRESALVLAWEQFAYCEDIVDQGVGTIEALAATLLNGTVWYFWWD